MSAIATFAGLFIALNLSALIVGATANAADGAGTKPSAAPTVAGLGSSVERRAVLGAALVPPRAGKDWHFVAIAGQLVVRVDDRIGDGGQRRSGALMFGAPTA